MVSLNLSEDDVRALYRVLRTVLDFTGIAHFNLDVVRVEDIMRKLCAEATAKGVSLINPPTCGSSAEDIDVLIADIDRLGEENEELKERMEVIDRHLEWAYMAIKAKEISAARVSISNARMIAAGMTEEEMLKAVAGDGL